MDSDETFKQIRDIIEAASVGMKRADYVRFIDRLNYETRRRLDTVIDEKTDATDNH